jgi:hypothetical protein
MNDPYQTRQFFNMRPETTIKLKRIIKEEIRSAIKEGVLGAEDVDNRIAQGLKRMAGIEPSENPNQNKFREKEYEVGYRYYYRDDYEWDTVTVTAKSPEEAIKKVKNREVSGVPRTASDIAIVEPKNEEFKRMQELAGVSENEGGNTHRSKVDWYYINEDSDYPGPKGRVVPIAAGYEDPRNFDGTELYISAETEGYVEGNSFFDEEGNDVQFDEQYFEKI